MYLMQMQVFQVLILCVLLCCIPVPIYLKEFLFIIQNIYFSIEKEHEETKKCLAVVQEKNEILKMNFQEKVSV